MLEVRKIYIYLEYLALKELLEQVNDIRHNPSNSFKKKKFFFKPKAHFNPLLH